MQEQHTLTEAQEVARREGKRKVYPSDREPRFATHINWNKASDLELFYCAAMRKMPHGYAKRVLIKALDLLLPAECREPEEAARIMLEFIRAPTHAARAALGGADTAAWRDDAPRMTIEGTLAQQRLRRSEVTGLPRTAPPAGMEWALVQRRSEAPSPPPEPPQWEAAYDDPRGYPEPPDVVPPQAAPRGQYQRSLHGLMGGVRP